jgi:predicted PurR-regulated permease PerM
MLQKLQQNKILFWTLELLAIAILILVITQMSFILEPIGKFFGSVFVPIVVSGFVFYLLNPVVVLLEKIKIGNWHVPRGLAIAFVMLLFVFVLAGALFALVPALITQLTNLANSIPQLVAEVQTLAKTVQSWDWVQRIGVEVDLKSLQKQLASIAESFVSGTATGLTSVIGTITSITVTAITVPVMTIYMLHDGHKLSPFIQRVIPRGREGHVAEILSRMNQTIQKYISGQAIEMVFVGVFTAIGYSLIGTKYGLLLGVIAGITNIIPYVGPYIGIVPALFVAFTMSPWMIVKVIIVVLVVQQIDGNLIYPRIIGQSLNIHPMTIIVLLLAAGNIAGIGGMILAIPTYAVLRTVVVYAWQLRQSDTPAEVLPENVNK